MGKIQIHIPKEKIAEFCKKWEIRELYSIRLRTQKGVLF